MVSQERHIAAMDRIAALVNVRERCVFEVRERLKKAEFTEEEIDDAIQSALRCDLVNEERFVRAYIRGKSNCGWGRVRILRNLRSNKISEDLIALCEEEFPSEEAAYARALHELQRKPSHAADKYSSYLRRLVNKGYPMEVAQRAVKEHLSASK